MIRGIYIKMRNTRFKISCTVPAFTAAEAGGSMEEGEAPACGNAGGRSRSDHQDVRCRGHGR